MTIREAIVTSDTPAALKALDATIRRVRRPTPSTVLVAAAQEGDPAPARGEHDTAAAAFDLVHLAVGVHEDLLHLHPHSDESVALECGDALAAAGWMWLSGRALTLIADCREPVRKSLASALSQASRGDLQKICDLFDVNRTPEHYLRATRGRAALLEAAAQTGALLGDADEESVSRLSIYGRELGLASTIARDLSDLLGPSPPGRLHGDGILRGAYSLPVAYALAEDARLRERLASTRPTSDELSEVVANVAATGGVGRAREDCRHHATAARQAVEGRESAQPLIAIVDAVVAEAGLGR
jgi:geranylgeranyl pyrophosphate synthase